MELRRYGRTVIALLEAAGERPERTPQAACAEGGATADPADGVPAGPEADAAGDGDDEDLASFGEEE